MAAKSLLHDAPRGTFDVTLFDAQQRIGGLWPSHKDDSAGLVHPRMVANQSKHTVQFSDLAWPEDAPQLPRAWHIGQYLALYLQTYCADAKLSLGTRVEKAEPQTASTSDGLQNGWRVQTRSLQGEVKEETFDYLLVASGFFGKPALPSIGHGDHEIPVIHSSQYRDLQGLLGQTDGSGGKVLVVGGQMSGVEILGTIASHLSSAVHSPGPSPIPNPEKYTVHHIAQQPVWVFPLHTSPKVGTDKDPESLFTMLTRHSPPHLLLLFYPSTWGPTTFPTESIPSPTRRDTSPWTRPRSSIPFIKPLSEPTSQSSRQQLP